MFSLRKIYLVLIAAGLLLTACGGQTVNDTGDVNITLTEFGIESSKTDFQVGVPYHFVVINKGQINHEIMIMPPVMGDMMGMDMGQFDEMALVMIGADKMTPGMTMPFDYTFTEPAPVGSLEFACHTPGHYEAGMKLPIIVK